MRRVRMTPAGMVLAGGAFGIVGYGIGPDVLSDLIYPITVLASIGCTVVGTVRNQAPRLRRPWWAIVAAEVVFYAAAVLRLVLPPDQAQSTNLTASLPDLV